jgi:selenocysteine lyase/cysteine desulfurase
MQPNPDTVSPAAAFAPRRLYLDNAATSFPKPRAVTDAMVRYATELGASAGRGAYREAVETGNLIAECRRRLNRLFNGERPEHFVFTLNCSDALNLAIKGLVDGATGGGTAAAGRPVHAVCTHIDHNSILRPLNELEARGRITQTQVPVDPATGLVDPDDVRRAIRPDTRWSRSRTPAT